MSKFAAGAKLNVTESVQVNSEPASTFMAADMARNFSARIFRWSLKQWGCTRKRLGETSFVSLCNGNGRKRGRDYSINLVYLLGNIKCSFIDCEVLRTHLAMQPHGRAMSNPPHFNSRSRHMINPASPKKKLPNFLI
jgi:hypothetical protein